MKKSQAYEIHKGDEGVSEKDINSIPISEKEMLLRNTQQVADKDRALVLLNNFQKSALNILHRLRGRIGGTAQPRGYLDQIDKFTLVGWAVSDQGNPAELQVRIDGKVIECNTVRQHRADVADALGTNKPNVGFEIELPAMLWDKLPQKGGWLELLCDGKSLVRKPIKLTRATAIGWITDIIQMKDCPEKQFFLHLALQHVRHGGLLFQLAPSDANFIRKYAANVCYRIDAHGTVGSNFIHKTEPSENVSTIRGNIEQMDKFSLVGWAVDQEDKPVDLTVHINGISVDCKIVREERRDVSDVLNISNLCVGFTLELPGYIWEQVGDAEDVRIEISSNEQKLTENFITLSREKAAKWISDIAQIEEGPEKQYLALLALEHVRYGRLNKHLQNEAVAYIQSFAREMKLEDFVFSQDNDAREKESIPTESASTLLLWKAMRSLNTKLLMTDDKNEVYGKVVEVLSEYQLIGEARDWFLFLASQLTCESGEFHKMRDILDFRKLGQLSESNTPTHMTLALPALVADGLIDEASDTLIRLREHLNDGWIHTACIRFATGEVLRMESEGIIDVTKAERFRYEYIHLLDSFKGEWFSRLHDQEFINTMIRMIENMDSYTDYMRKDLAAAAVRNFGICPGFWDKLTGPDRPPLSAELSLGYQMWGEIHSVIHGWSPVPAKDALGKPVQDAEGQLNRLLKPLTWFYHQGNAEAIIVLREVLMSMMPVLNNHMDLSSELLIKQLLEFDGAEEFRIAAFPLASRNALHAKIRDTGEQLFNRLRGLIEDNQGFVHDLQLSAAGTLKKAGEASDSTIIYEALKLLENKSIYLSNIRGGVLGVDLLASGYVLATKAGLDSSRILMRLQETMRKAIAQTEPDQYLPAPFHAAMARLQSQSADPLLTGFLREINHAIREKFPSWHEDAFKAPEKLLAVDDISGWPHDTLVAIFSSRDRIDASHPVRQAWISDLDARKIPYLFVVGGTEDSVQADVLTLKVPDQSTNQVEKTLKFYEWAFNNTNAQYVLKIDDDCFLEVERYFDTLSYRKHFYYGRVVSKDIGFIDRTGQQGMVQQTGINISLDKSPEPSIYADSAGSYSLSRFAIAKLLKEKQSGAGARLVLCSTREDKLVGDLLSLCNIEPSNEDFTIFERHCTTTGALPVAKGENTFYPCKITPAKVAHLDTVHDLLQAREIANSEELLPKKIWPTYLEPSVKRNSNQLELITEPGRMWPLLGNKLAVVAVVRNEMVMLPHFLEHYRKLGVKCFIFADNCSDDGTREYLYEQPDTVLYSADTEYKLSHYGVSWQQAILGNLCLGKWVVVADADELLVYENCESDSLAEYVERIEADGSDSVITHMIDMYPFGDLDEACFEKGAPFDVAPYFDREAQIELKFGGGHFSNSRNYVSGLRHRIAPSRINSYVSQKYALFKYKPWMRLTEGIHYSANMKVSKQEAFFAHFKYHSGFKSKVLAEIKRNQHYNGAEEYQRYANMLAEGQGGFGKEGVTVKYHDSSSFVDLLK